MIRGKEPAFYFLFVLLVLNSIAGQCQFYRGSNVSFGKNSSLGLVYSAITEWANFVPNEDEYKVMALAAFGKPVYSNYILDNIFNFLI
jgi:predicted NodU family carbamoyl transferase